MNRSSLYAVFFPLRVDEWEELAKAIGWAESMAESEAPDLAPAITGFLTRLFEVMRAKNERLAVPTDGEQRIEKRVGDGLFDAFDNYGKEMSVLRAHWDHAWFLAGHAQTVEEANLADNLIAMLRESITEAQRLFAKELSR